MVLYLLFLALFAGVSPDNRIYVNRESLSWEGIRARSFLSSKQLGTPELLDCLKLRGGSSVAELGGRADEEFDFQDGKGEVKSCLYISLQWFKLP